MTELEQQVWAASYAASFMNELSFRQRHVGAGSIDEMGGFSHAEIADSAVEKLREALTGDDAEYLLPVKESR